MINEAFARRSGRMAIHQRSDHLGEGPRQIVGMVSDVRDAVTRAPQSTIYTLSAHLTNVADLSTPWAWLIRTRVAPQSLSAVIE